MRAPIVVAALLALSAVAVAPVAAAEPDLVIENPCDWSSVECHPGFRTIVDWVCANPFAPCT